MFSSHALWCFFFYADDAAMFMVSSLVQGGRTGFETVVRKIAFSWNKGVILLCIYLLKSLTSSCKGWSVFVRKEIILKILPARNCE